jgi:hypothetical protein
VHVDDEPTRLVFCSFPLKGHIKLWHRKKSFLAITIYGAKITCAVQTRPVHRVSVVGSCPT